MSILQRVGQAALNALFHFSLFATISIISIVAVFGSSSSPKQALKRSGLYDKVVLALVDESKAHGKDSSIPLDDPGVRRVIDGAFPSDFVQASSETVIDGIYDWLQGKHKTINFTVDFRLSKIALGEGLGAYAFNRVASLPPCKDVAANYDPFKADCRSPLAGLATEKAKLAQDITQSPDILPQSVVTDSSLPKTSNGQRLDQAYSGAPSIFQLLTALPFLMGGLTAVLGLVVIRLQRNARQGVRTLAGALASDAVFLSFSTLLFGKVLPMVAPALSLRLQGGGVQALLDKPLQILSDRVENTVLLCCLVLVVIAVSLVLLEKGTRPKKARGKGGKKRNSKTKVKQTVAGVPIQSSEESRSRPPRRIINKKYGKIPKGT